MSDPLTEPIIYRPADSSLPPGTPPQPYVLVDGVEFSASAFRYLQSEYAKANQRADVACAQAGLLILALKAEKDHAHLLAAYGNPE